MIDQNQKHNFSHAVSQKTDDHLLKEQLRHYAQTQLENLKIHNQNYYQELTEKYKLTPERVAIYAISFYQKSNFQNNYTDLLDFASRFFSSNQKDLSPLLVYIDYLINQQSYSVNTVNAGANMPLLNRSLGIYRHGYIQIYNSPFSNGKKNQNIHHEILELNPSGQTNELNAKSVTGNIRVVPGIITMALHLAGRQRLATGEYDLINYRPWVNDCQTYFKHAQETMNSMLIEIDLESGKALQQEVIDHYRYKPGMNQKEAQWLRRQAGAHLVPDQKIFEVTEKGVAIISSESSAEVIEPISENFRNVLEDREMEVSPSHHMLSYTAWVMKQFAQSTLDRAMKHVNYKKMEFSTQGKIRSLIKQIRKQDGFVCEMIYVLNMDFINMHMSAEKTALFSSYYQIVFDFKDALLKQSETLAVLLHKLNNDPFNTKMNNELEDQKKKLSENNINLRKAILKIYNKMSIQDIQSPLVKKNLVNAISDLEIYQKKLIMEVEKVLTSGVKPGAELLRFSSERERANSSTSDFCANTASVESQINHFLNTVTFKYCQIMADAKAKVWGGDIEVQQLGILKNLKICVHYKGSAQPPVILGSSESNQTIHLLYSGNHYEVCDALAKVTYKTAKEDNCLFEAVIMAERKIMQFHTTLSKSALSKEIAELRKQVAEKLLNNYQNIQSGKAYHCPPGFKGDPVKLTQRDDPVWVRFNAIFEAENAHQLRQALNLLPTCALKSEAEDLRKQLDKLNLRVSINQKNKVKFIA